MNLNVTIADDVRQDVACCVKDWFNEVGEWSQARYPKVNLETGTVISVETHETFSGIAYQPQKRPFVIRISDLCDFIHWSVDIMHKYHFKPTGRYYVGNEIGMKAAMVAAFNAVQYTLARDIGDEAFREGWTVQVDPPEAKLAWLKEKHPELVDSWWDQERYKESIKKTPSATHWTFPPLAKGLRRISGCGPSPGGIYPPGSGRS